MRRDKAPLKVMNDIKTDILKQRDKTIDEGMDLRRAMLYAPTVYVPDRRFPWQRREVIRILAIRLRRRVGSLDQSCWAPAEAAPRKWKECRDSLPCHRPQTSGDTSLSIDRMQISAPADADV